METADDRVGFVWGDNTRSTFMLLWSCLVTIFVCTWTVIHLNIPAPYESVWSIAGSKLKWFFITLAAPEFTILIALRQHSQCGKFTQTMKNIYPYWTMSHSFFVMMGGYVLQFENSANYRYHDPKPHSISDSWACFRRGTCEHWQVPGLAIWRLSLVDFDRLRARGMQPPFQIPELSEKDVQDRGKVDGFAKLFTCAQVAWMIVQCVARAVEDLQISELEIMTLAYVSMALAMYLLWWHKPYNAQIPVIIPFEGDPFRLLSIERFDHRLSMNYGSDSGDRVLIGSVFVATLFGIIHCAAWKFSFATQREEKTWRVFSIVVTVSPAIVCCAYLYYIFINSNIEVRKAKIVGMLVGFISFTYVTARAILLFQVFYCLRSMPAGTCSTVAWINYIPHVG